MPSNVNVKVDMSSALDMLKRRGLQPKGPCQRFFTHEVRRLSDPYVPMQTGTLKNTAVELTDRIEYRQIYSVKQYYENKGMGMRGKQWDKRMWATRGPEIINAVAVICGGRRVE